MELEDYIQSTHEVFPDKGIQNTRIFISQIGDINTYKTFKRKKSMKVPDTVTHLSGAGTGSQPQHAAFLSKMEALERLANSLPVAETIVDTAENLGEKAIDLSLFPKLATYEIGFNQNFKENGILKWVKSINISTNEIKYIPQVYINLFTQKDYDGENITNPISTGCAIHTNYADAILNGLYEVIERDGIALSWLLKTPMDRLKTNGLMDKINVFDNNFIGETQLFDASTIKGVHTFCLRARTNYAERLRNIFMFSTHVDPNTALDKINKELISVLYSLSSEPNSKDQDIMKMDYQNFVGVSESALYMGHPEQDHEFDFLNQTNEKDFPENVNSFANATEELKHLIQLLKEQGHDINVTDLTNRECLENNLKAVMVTVPTLQPISFVHRARYLDSDRIRNYAKDIYGEFREDMINHKPLPFS